MKKSNRKPYLHCCRSSPDYGNTFSGQLVKFPVRASSCVAVVPSRCVEYMAAEVGDAGNPWHLSPHTTPTCCVTVCKVDIIVSTGCVHSVLVVLCYNCSAVEGEQPSPLVHAPHLWERECAKVHVDKFGIETIASVGCYPPHLSEVRPRQSGDLSVRPSGHVGCKRACVKHAVNDGSGGVGFSVYIRISTRCVCSRRAR